MATPVITKTPGVIRKYIKKNLTKATDEGIMVIPTTQKVDYHEAIMKELLIKEGIDPDLIKTENQLNEALAFIKQGEKITPPATSENVIDITDKMPSPFENIETAKKKGDFRGIFNQVMKDPEIAREFMLSKKFPFDPVKNVRSGEDAIPLARAAKFDEEMKKLNVSATPGKDAKGTVGEFVNQMKKFNVSDKDIQMMLSSGKSSQVPYAMEQYGLSASDVVDILKRGDPLIEGLAKGGRAGFKVGSPSKRLFLKTAGGLAALITAIKSGLIGVPKKEVTKQVVKESVKDVANAPPKYFFDLANKIKLLGKESKVKPQERVNEYNYKGKNGDEYTLTEDISTGDMQITKDKTGIGTVDEKSFDTINDRSVMEYKAPRKDADPETRTTIDEGAEYDEYRVEFDMDGTPADGDIISENIKKEIIQESKYPIRQKLKRAGGGVAYMLGE